MNDNKTYLNLLNKELSTLGILLRRNSAVSHTFEFSLGRGLSYFDFWSLYYEKNWYDFQFKDMSLLSFFESNDKITTCSYLGCPVQDIITEEEYYKSEDLYGVGIPYGDYVSSLPKLENVSYVRFDSADKQYINGLHPLNHFHFGYNQDSRIGVCYHIGIVAFAAMILRQYYPDSWKKVLKTPRDYPTLYSFKSKLVNVEDDYYRDLDCSHDLYLK